MRLPIVAGRMQDRGWNDYSTQSPAPTSVVDVLSPKSFIRLVRCQSGKDLRAYSRGQDSFAPGREMRQECMADGESHSWKESPFFWMLSLSSTVRTAFAPTIALPDGSSTIPATTVEVESAWGAFSVARAETDMLSTGERRGFTISCSPCSIPRAARATRKTEFIGKRVPSHVLARQQC